MKLKSIKFWLNVVTIGALVLLIIFARKQVGDAFKTFADLNMLWMLLVIPLQLLNHFSVAKFYQSYLKTLGEHIKTRELFKVSLEMNFVNNVFPSGGVSGFGYLGIRLKKLGVRGSKSTLVQTSRHILTFLSIILFLIIGMMFLSIFGTTSRLVILIASSLTSFIIFMTLALMYIVSDEKRIKQATVALPKLLNSIFGIFHKKKKQIINVDKVEGLFGELHQDYLHVRRNWKDLRHPLKWTIFMNLTEILTIFVVYLAFGELVNPG
ncbi:MAG: lysylphosphatidylglycerol synthase transmembrane domain-containing protein, partial [Candidatus Zixiibacteriota bacterium]